MTNSLSASTAATPQDRILPLTRIVAALVVPFLLLAFLILYLYPEQSGQRFAWEVRPAMAARFIGAGYLGGAYLFLRTIVGRRWHEVAAGFLPVTTFTIGMLLATIVHWDRFDLHHFPFQLWLVLYLITPVLVPAIWLYNRRQDPGTVEAGDAWTPAVARWALRLLGGFLMLFAVGGFLFPLILIAIWPWDLSPLMARLLAGWLALLGVGGLVIGRERRWSGWRVGLQSIAIWHVLVLLGAVLSRDDFHDGLLNWYLVSVVLVLAGMALLYARMALRDASA